MHTSIAEGNRYIQLFRGLMMLYDLLKWYSICGLCPLCNFQCSTWNDLPSSYFIHCVIYSVVPEAIFLWLCLPCNL